MTLHKSETRGRYGRRAAAQPGGFTLLELLVALMIIATFAAITVPNLTGQFSSDRQKAYNNDRDNLELASTSYFADPTVSGGPGIYPTYSGTGGSFSGGASGSTINLQLLLTAGYLKSAPRSGGNFNLANNGGTYTYYVDSTGKVFSSPGFTGTYP